MGSQLRKLIIVGDGAAGKTSLSTVLARWEFSGAYVSTVVENYVIDIDVNGQLIELALWDTSIRADYENRLYRLIYPDAYAFLICFSIACPDSLENVRERWHPEIQHFGGGMVPRFLVGRKKDLRHDPTTLSALARYSRAPVTTEEGEDMAKVIGAEYFECSSKTGEGVRELFARVTERMEAEKVARYMHKRRNYYKPWYRGGGCIVV